MVLVFRCDRLYFQFPVSTQCGIACEVGRGGDVGTR